VSNKTYEPVTLKKPNHDNHTPSISIANSFGIS